MSTARLVAVSAFSVAVSVATYVAVRYYAGLPQPPPKPVNRIERARQAFADDQERTRASYPPLMILPIMRLGMTANSLTVKGEPTMLDFSPDRDLPSHFSAAQRNTAIGLISQGFTRLVKAMSGLVLAEKYDIDALFDNITRTTTASNPAHLVTRVAPLCLLGAERSLLELFDDCTQISEIAGPVELFAFLFQQSARSAATRIIHPERRFAHWGTDANGSLDVLTDEPPPNAFDTKPLVLLADSPLAQDGPNLSLTFLTNDLASDGFASAETSDVAAARRVTKALFAQAGAEHVLLERPSFFHTFASLTHLSLRLPYLGNIEPSLYVSTCLALSPNLQQFVFMGPLIHGVHRVRESFLFEDRVFHREIKEPDEWTDLEYGDEVLLRHVFSDRRCLYMPDVPECENADENDAFVGWWTQRDVWREAPEATARAALSLLRTVLSGDVRINDDNVSFATIARLLQAPHRPNTHLIPLLSTTSSQAITRLMTKVSIDPTLEAPIADVKVFIDALGGGVKDVEASWQVVDAALSGGAPNCRLTLLGTNTAPTGAPCPNRTTSLTKGVKTLCLPAGFSSYTDFNAGAFSAITELIMPISPPNVHELLILGQQLKESLERITLIPPSVEPAADVVDTLAESYGIEVVL